MPSTSTFYYHNNLHAGGQLEGSLSPSLAHLDMVSNTPTWLQMALCEIMIVYMLVFFLPFFGTPEAALAGLVMYHT